MGFVTFKKAGETGKVAINSDRVTHVRSTTPLFTDIYFGDHQVSVEGPFNQVIAQLTGSDSPPADPPWIASAMGVAR